MKYVALIAAILLGGNSLYAIAPLPPSPWSGNIQLGFTGTNGNSRDNNLANKLNVIYLKDKWTNTFRYDSLFASSNDKTTAARFSGTVEFDYALRTRLFAFARDNSYYDRFNAYDAASNSAAGLGWRIFNGTDLTIDVQAGPGYRWAKVAGSGEEFNERTIYTGTNLSWTLSPNASFQQTFNVDSGSNNTLIFRNPD